MYVCVPPPPNHKLKPDPQSDGIWRWSLREVIGVNGIRLCFHSPVYTGTLMDCSLYFSVHGILIRRLEWLPFLSRIFLTQDSNPLYIPALAEAEFFTLSGASPEALNGQCPCKGPHILAFLKPWRSFEKIHQDQEAVPTIAVNLLDCWSEFSLQNFGRNIHFCYL